MDKFIAQLKIQFANDIKKASLQCKKCGSQQFTLFGLTKAGSQRYLCKRCNKTFVMKTDKANDTSRKNIETWDLFVSCMIHQLSVRKSGKVCNISKNTAFRWRHQLFESLMSIYNNNQELAIRLDESLQSEIFDVVPTEPQPSFVPGPERYNVQGWIGVQMKNISKYRLWEAFVKEAIQSGYEKEFIAKKVLKC